MNDFTGKEEIDRVLTVLGRQMALAYAGSVTLLCCGGAALCRQGLIARATKDIDALAVIIGDDILQPIDEFSPEMEKAIDETARAFGLNANWLNGAASIVLQRGLPAGILQRSAAHRKTYGSCLTVQFTDRLDLIALKLFAAMDPTKGRRHASDLIEVKPNEREISHAVNWMLGWKSNAEFKKRLAFLVEGLGFSQFTTRIVGR
jgi:hypothetical protein